MEEARYQERKPSAVSISCVFAVLDNDRDWLFVRQAIWYSWRIALHRVDKGMACAKEGAYPAGGPPLHLYVFVTG